MAEYFTLVEFAALKKTTRQTIYSAINRNEIDSVQLYGKTLIKKNKKNDSWQVKVNMQRFK
jgi:predicted DNA-binding protein YlxM (UPF0122 family)